MADHPTTAERMQQRVEAIREKQRRWQATQDAKEVQLELGEAPEGEGE